MVKIKSHQRKVNKMFKGRKYIKGRRWKRTRRNQLESLEDKVRKRRNKEIMERQNKKKRV